MSLGIRYPNQQSEITMETTTEALATNDAVLEETAAASTDAVETTAVEAVETAPSTEPTPVGGEAKAETPENYQLRGSPRWNAAAEVATAKGLKPGSHDWMEDIRETLRQQPDLNKPKQAKKDRPQGKQGNRPEGQGPKQGKKQEKGPRPPRQEGQDRHQNGLHPAFVNYSAIASMLLKASRFRRNQHLRQGNEISTATQVREFYSISIGGPRQSGKTRFLLDRFQRYWSTSLTIVKDNSAKEYAEKMLAEINPTLAGSQVKEMLKRVMTVKEVMDDVARFAAGDQAQKERPRLVIEIDPTDTNPSVTLAGKVGDYLELQRQMIEGQPSATHPTLMPLQTVYIDDQEACQAVGLSFQRLVRFLRIGSQTPEIVVIQH